MGRRDDERFLRFLEKHGKRSSILMWVGCQIDYNEAVIRYALL